MRNNDLDNSNNNLEITSDNNKEKKQEIEIKKDLYEKKEEDILEYPISPPGTTTSGIESEKDIKDLQREQGTSGAKIIKETERKVQIEEKLYGISKPKRIIIKGKIFHDMD